MTLLAVKILLPSLFALSNAQLSQPPNHLLTGAFFGTPGINKTYDYIVIGGGTAGLTIASRLAENPSLSIALVEAGGFYELENGNTSQVPGLDYSYDSVTADSQWTIPAVDWGFLTIPQKEANNRVFHYGRGRTLGECSAQNSMIYNRGTKDCYDGWANLSGDASLSWSSFLPYFTRGTNYSSPSTTTTPFRALNALVSALESAALNTVGGPLHLSFPNFALPFSSYAKEAFAEIVVPEVQSLIGSELLGAQYNPFTISPDYATRGISQTSYLRAAIEAGRSNLKVYTHTMATRILFNQSSSPARATGVQVMYANTPPFTLSASREVILNAGAIQSPQLLMVSGIGPPSILSQHNITIIAASPGVGQNLREHTLILLSRRTNIPIGFGSLNNASYAEQAQKEYYTNQTGPLSNGGTDFLGWEKLPQPYRCALGSSAQELDDVFPSDWPELETEIASAERIAGETVNIGTVIQSLVAPLSRGNITLRSNSMLDPPVIDLGLLSHPISVRTENSRFSRPDG